MSNSLIRKNKKVSKNKKFTEIDELSDLEKAKTLLYLINSKISDAKIDGNDCIITTNDGKIFTINGYSMSNKEVSMENGKEKE